MSVDGKQADGHNLQAALDELHADVYRHNMAPIGSSTAASPMTMTAR